MFKHLPDKIETETDGLFSCIPTFASSNRTVAANLIYKKYIHNTCISQN